MMTDDAEVSVVEALPIDPFLQQVIAALEAGRDVVLIAEPGAGKTTRIPPAIVKGKVLTGGQHLVMLQPRRIAARAAASRIADEERWQLGREIGYQVRFEKMLRDDTPLRIYTEGMLVRQLVGDPGLESVGCVVLDEFHERSIHADLSLAMLREAKQALREDLRLVVMSATLDADAVASFLRETGDVEIFHVPGRLYPVDVSYSGDDPRPIEERIARVLDNELTTLETVGDVLVFLPGVREIERTMDAIRRSAARVGYDVLPLHGSLTKEEQDEAVRFSSHDRPRVICATNVAETSLTLPGVRLVIDSGLVRQAGYDANRGVQTLTTERISKASAEQRAGRAGRVAAGRCIRLWSKMTHHRLPDFDVPEIQRVDLCEASLAVRAWGGGPESFGWYESPPVELLASAATLLEGIGAVEDGRLTALGKRLQSLPLHPRPARLLASAPRHLLADATLAAALLGEGAELPGRRTATIHDLIAAFDSRKLDATVDRAVRRARDALSRFHIDTKPATVDTLEELLLLAYPDRVCRRRAPETATLVNGGGVRLADASAVRGEWFLALDVRRGNFAQAQQADARLVAEIGADWLEQHLPHLVAIDQTAEWKNGRAVAVRRKRFGDLTMDESRGGKIDAADAKSLLLEHCSLADAEESVASLGKRVGMLRRHLPAHLQPDGEASFDDAAVLEDAIDAAVAAGEPSAAGVTKRLADAMRNRLWSTSWHRLIDDHAPEAIEVPTGSRIRLDWSVADIEERRGPVLAVRLQELFGLADTPRLCGGTVRVILHLLGPNYRPVQVTDDLASFWKNTYPQVKKDLRGRYPKHSWPDDPLAADPLRGPRRRGQPGAKQS